MNLWRIHVHGYHATTAAGVNDYRPPTAAVLEQFATAPNRLPVGSVSRETHVLVIPVTIVVHVSPSTTPPDSTVVSARKAFKVTAVNLSTGASVVGILVHMVHVFQIQLVRTINIRLFIYNRQITSLSP